MLRQGKIVLATNCNCLIIRERFWVGILIDQQEALVFLQLKLRFRLKVRILIEMPDHAGVSKKWYDFELQGTENQITRALAYLQSLNLEIWQGDETGAWKISYDT
jgi:hypothetical protein